MELADYRFLIVDDHFLLRQMMAASLKSFGLAKCDTANDGVQALEQIKRAESQGRPYQVLFLDWNMPVMDGMAVLEEIRARKEWDCLAVIMVSSEVESVNVIRAIQAGATAYITKPFKPETVLARLKEVETWRKGKAVDQ